MILTTRNAAVGFLVLLWSGSTVATPIPIIRGTIPEFSEPGFVVLFQDDGNGVFDPGAEAVSAAYPTTDGTFEFGGLSSNSQYFVGFGETVSEILSPGKINTILDDFTGVGEAEADPLNTNVSMVMLTEALGASRRLTTTLEAGSGSVELAAGEFDDTIRFAVGPGAEGVGMITWDGATDSTQPLPALSLNGVDLTAGGALNAFALYAGFDLSSTGGEFALRIFDQNEPAYSELVVPIPINGGLPTEMVTFPFQDFSGPVSADNVDAVQLVIRNAPGSADGQIAEFGLVQMEIEPEFFNTIVAVGEPQGILPLAFGLGAIVFLRNPRRPSQPD